MRSARIGADGILRDAYGVPAHLLLMGRKHVPQSSDVASSPRHRILTSPSRPSTLGQETKLPEREGAAILVAKQVGVPADSFKFSMRISDPETTIYPGRMIYQKSGDDRSLYLVSNRIPEDTGSVKLLKIEGPGRGRWYDVPLTRGVIDGKMMPGLLTDFMVVPYKYTGIVWAYVGPVAPIFDDSENPKFEVVYPDYIRVVFELAITALEIIAFENDMIRDPFYVYHRSSAALLFTFKALDIAAASLDVSVIGFKAFALYSAVAKKLYEYAERLFTLSIRAINDKSVAESLLREIGELRNRLSNDADLYRLYLYRAQLFFEWDRLYSMTHLQDTNAIILDLMEGTSKLIERDRAEVRRRLGASDEEIDFIYSISKLVVSRDRAYGEKYLSTISELLKENDLTINDLYLLEFLYPKLLQKNLDAIKSLMHSSVKANGGRLGAYAPTELGTLGAYPPPIPEFKDQVNKFAKAAKGALDTIIYGSKNIVELRMNFKEKFIKAVGPILESTIDITKRLITSKFGLRKEIPDPIRGKIDIFMQKTQKLADLRMDRSVYEVEKKDLEHQLKPELERLENELKEVKNKVENEVKPLKNKLEELEQEVKIIKEADAETPEKKQKRDAAVAERVKEIEKIKAAIAQKEKDISQKEAEIDKKRKPIKEKEERIESTDSEINSIISEIGQITKEITNDGKNQRYLDVLGRISYLLELSRYISELNTRLLSATRDIPTPAIEAAVGFWSQSSPVIRGLGLTKAKHLRTIPGFAEFLYSIKAEFEPINFSYIITKVFNVHTLEEASEAVANILVSKSYLGPIIDAIARKNRYSKEAAESEVFNVVRGYIENRIIAAGYQEVSHYIEKSAPFVYLYDKIHRVSEHLRESEKSIEQQEYERYRPTPIPSQPLSEGHLKAIVSSLEKINSMLNEPTGPGREIKKIINPETDLGKSIAKYNVKLKNQIHEIYNELQKDIPALSAVLKDYRASAPKDAKEIDVLNNEINSKFEYIKKRSEELMDLIFKRALPQARMMHFIMDNVLGVMVKAIKMTYDLRNGLGATIIEKAKDTSGIIAGLYHIPGTIAYLTQIYVWLATIGVVLRPAAQVKDLINYVIGAIIGGGDPPQDRWVPGAKADKGAPSLGLIGFALLVTIMAYGKDFFEAVGKTTGGFFQFATALLPSSAKRKGARGGGGGAGAGAGAGAPRRGAPVRVDIWMRELEAAKNRLAQAKDENEKNAAQRAVNKAIEKLKKAKEEGQAVPEGLWGYNWMG